MQDMLIKIKSDIDTRLQYQAAQFQKDGLAKQFQQNVLIPAGQKFAALLDSQELSQSDYEHESYFKSYAGTPTVTRLKGLDVVSNRSDFYEIYEIEMDFDVGSNKTLSLEAVIRRSTMGEGSEVRDWEVTLNGEDIESLFTETDTDGKLDDFIIEHFQAAGHFDSNQKELSENDLKQILSILGVAA